jgi:hypothetical protein
MSIHVELDEVSLSLVGWEVVNLQARLLIEEFDKRSYYNRVAASGEVRHHPDDWQVRFNRTNLSTSNYLPPIIWQLRSKTHGPLMNYQQMVLALKAKEVPAPKLISAKMDLWRTTFRHVPEDLYIWIGAADWEEIDDWHSKPSATWSEIPVELANYTTVAAIRSETRELVARVRDREKLEVTVSLLHPLGTPTELLSAAIHSDEFFGDPDAPIDEQDEFVVQAPDLSINIFDDAGFLLDSRELSNYRWVTVEQGGRRPNRPPSFVAVTTTRLSDLVGTPARVLVRLTDPVA